MNTIPEANQVLRATLAEQMAAYEREHGPVVCQPINMYKADSEVISGRSYRDAGIAEEVRKRMEKARRKVQNK